MIAQIMIFALGFLVAGLSALLVLPLFWRRARRLARRSVEMSLPLSVNEVLADRDRLRAAFAVEHCRLEQKIDSVDAKRGVALAALARTETSLQETLERAVSAEAAAQAHHAEAADLSVQLGALAKALFDAQHGLDLWQGRARELDETKERLELELSASEAAFGASQTRAAALEQQLTETAGELAAARAAHADAAARIETLLAEAEAVRERAEEAELFGRATLARANSEEQRASLLSRTLDLTKSELEDAQGQADVLRREVAKAEARTDALRASLERQADARKSLDSDVSARLVNAERQISSLKNALDEARREASELRRGSGSRRGRSQGRETRQLKGLEVVSEERSESSTARAGESLLDRPA